MPGPSKLFGKLILVSLQIYWLLTETDRHDVFAHKMKRTPGDFANIQLIAID